MTFGISSVGKTFAAMPRKLRLESRLTRSSEAPHRWLRQFQYSKEQEKRWTGFGFMPGVVQMIVEADEKRGAILRGLDWGERAVVFIPVNEVIDWPKGYLALSHA